MMVVEWAMMMIGWVDGWAVDDATRFTGGRTQMCGEYPAGTHHFLSSLVLAPTTGFFTTGPTNLGWPIFSVPTNLSWPTWFDQFFPHNLFTSSSSLTSTTAPHCSDHSPRQFEHSIGKQQTRFKPHYTPCILYQPLRSNQQGCDLYWIKSYFSRLHLFLSCLTAKTDKQAVGEPLREGRLW